MAGRRFPSARIVAVLGLLAAMLLESAATTTISTAAETDGAARSPSAATPPVSRWQGPDRFATAATISAEVFEPGVPVAYVATGATFPDALAGGPLASRTGGPILLTQRDGLPAATVTELQRLAPQRIAVLGGRAAVSDDVLAALRGLTTGAVDRIAGPDRFATAAAISRAGFDPGVAIVYVATGLAFPDALAGGAAGAVTGGPVLLTTREELPPDTIEEIRRLAPASIALLGGTGAIAASVAEMLEELVPGRVRRLAGPDRYATAVAIADDTFPSGAGIVVLATGLNFPDALAGAPAAGRLPGPLLLVTPTCAPSRVVSAVGRHGAERLVVLGGRGALSDAAAALETCPTAMPPTFAVDPAVVPRRAPLASVEPGGPDRPVARLVDEHGTGFDFVEGELIVTTASEDALQKVLDRWNGRVLKSFDLPDGRRTHLVAVDPSRGPVAQLTDLSQQIDPDSRGHHRTSSDSALGLVAAGAFEAVAGDAIVGLNALPVSSGYLDRNLREAPSGFLIDATYSSNPNDWSYMQGGGPQNFGVTEAWRILALADRLKNRVPIAIIDGGFDQTNPDYPSGTVGLGVPNPATCGDNPCPWHGTGVALTAGGVPDNGHGTAGTGGPVADLRLFHTDVEYIGVMAALFAARAGGARIINMSFGIALPATVSWANGPLEVVTAFVGSDRLLFAAAGNSGEDVDHEHCFIKCWEATWHAPCENAGVICVGGLASGSRLRARNSNYGRDSCGNPFCQVQLFGPFTVHIGSDTANPGNVNRVSNGTSFSSPWVAGVAALVWAADPSLRADQVRQILLDTAGRSPDTGVSRVVDARAAVLRAVGNVPPQARFTSPASGARMPYGVAIGLQGTASDDEDGAPCCQLRFSTNRADVDTLFSSSNQGTFTPGSPGARRLGIRAIDSKGATGPWTYIDVEAYNVAPVATVTNPNRGTLYVGVPYPFVGGASDVNQPEIGCEALTWQVNATLVPGATGTCRPRLTLPQSGANSVRVTATDEQGATHTTNVWVNPVPLSPTAPPVPVIYEPEDGRTFDAGTPVTVEGFVARHPDANSPLSVQWWQTNRSPGENQTPISLGSALEFTWNCPVPGNATGGSTWQRRLTLTANDANGTGSTYVDVYCHYGLH
jgi:serine protease